MDNLLTSDACTMPIAERPLRLAEFDDLFTTALQHVVKDGRRVRMHLSGPDGLVDRVRDLTARESQCCSFFTFTLGGTDEDLILEIAVPPAQQQVLDALADRARELLSA